MLQPCTCRKASALVRVAAQPCPGPQPGFSAKQGRGLSPPAAAMPQMQTQSLLSNHRNHRSEEIAGYLTMRVQQLDVACETKVSRVTCRGTRSARQRSTRQRSSPTQPSHAVLLKTCHLKKTAEATCMAQLWRRMPPAGLQHAGQERPCSQSLMRASNFHKTTSLTTDKGQCVHYIGRQYPVPSRARVPIRGATCRLGAAVLDGSLDRPHCMRLYAC